MDLVNANAEAYNFFQEKMGDNKFTEQFNTICDAVEHQGGSFQDPGIIQNNAQEKGLDNICLEAQKNNVINEVYV